MERFCDGIVVFISYKNRLNFFVPAV